MTLIFEPNPASRRPDELRGRRSGPRAPPDLLALTDAPAADGWPQTFSPTGAAVAAAGVGRVELAAPFLPTIPGTDAYVDQLR
jgi:hypothetical protein